MIAHSMTNGKRASGSALVAKSKFCPDCPQSARNCEYGIPALNEGLGSFALTENRHELRIDF